MKARTLTEVGLAVLAFYVFTSAVLYLGAGLGIQWTMLSKSGGVFAGLRLLLSVLGPGLLYALSAVVILLCRSSIARALFPEEATYGEKADGPAPDWEESAYRIGISLIGILVIATTLPQIVGQIAQLLELVRSHDSVVAPYRFSGDVPLTVLVRIVAQGIQVAVAVYLAVGAPRLRQWLLKRVMADGAAGAAQTAGADGDAAA